MGFCFSFSIVFRSGENPAKVAGLRPDYYYSDDPMVLGWIEQVAAKVGGREIHDIDQVIPIVLAYIGFNNCVDGLLNVKKEE